MRSTGKIYNILVFTGIILGFIAVPLNSRIMSLAGNCCIMAALIILTTTPVYKTGKGKGIARFITLRHVFIASGLLYFSCAILRDLGFNMPAMPIAGAVFLISAIIIAISRRTGRQW